MTIRETGQKLYVVIGSPWKDALLGYLSADAPDDNWDVPDGLRKGDLLLSLLETKPRTVLCLERVTRGGARLQVGVVLDWPWLPELAKVEAVSGLKVRKSAGWIPDEVADLLLEVLDSDQMWHSGSGDGSTAHDARVISNCDLRCEGCGEEFDLSGDDARNQVRVLAVEDQVRVFDEEARDVVTRCALCPACQRVARAAGVPTMTQLRRASFPACPRCGAEETSVIMWGMPPGPQPEWVEVGGCCINGDDPVWSCSACGHSWGSMLDPRSGDQVQAHLFNFDGRHANGAIPDVRDPAELQLGVLIVEEVHSAWGKYTKHVVRREDGAYREIEPETIEVLGRV